VENFVTRETHGHAAVITLNRPDALNAFTPAMVESLEREVRAAVADTAVTGVVITGSGRGFCAGLDTSALAETAESGVSAINVSGEPELRGLFSYLLLQPKPIIAAINGVTAGGGLVLVSKCDIRFASHNASFVTVFTRRGLIAEHGLTWLIPRLVGTGAALDMLWSSRKVDATEAYHMGLVQRLLSPEELLPAAIEYVNELAATVSPSALADTKMLVYRHFGHAMEESFVEADKVGWQAFSRPDATEGVASFLEKRPPKFTPLGEQ
jgi:enoyl-CoA hydratase/carnithine racemase